MLFQEWSAPCFLYHAANRVNEGMPEKITPWEVDLTVDLLIQMHNVGMKTIYSLGVVYINLLVLDLSPYILKR